MKKIIFASLIVLVSLAGFSQNSDKGVFDNAVYVRLGYALPGGTLKTEEAVTAGAQFEFGTIFYINKLSLPEKLKVGLDATFISISGFANRTTSMEDNKSDSYFTAGVKVGPCVSYNFTGQWIADAYFKVHPHQFIVGETENHNYEAANQFKLGTSFGLNVRYKALMVGCEFTGAKYDFETNIAVARSPQEVSTQAIKLPVTTLSIGVNF